MPRVSLKFCLAETAKLFCPPPAPSPLVARDCFSATFKISPRSCSATISYKMKRGNRIILVLSDFFSRHLATSCFFPPRAETSTTTEAAHQSLIPLMIVELNRWNVCEVISTAIRNIRDDCVETWTLFSGSRTIVHKRANFFLFLFFIFNSAPSATVNFIPIFPIVSGKRKLSVSTFSNFN